MKRCMMVGLSLILLIGFSVSCVWAESLKINMKAPDWSFKDGDGKAFTMESWAGKVLLVNYTDPDESDLNEHFTEAMKKAKDQGLLKDATYKGVGIADCKATWKPDVLIRSIGDAKAKKYNTTILFDYDASLRNAWGLAEDTANAILLDKNRVVKAIVRGRVPDDQVEAIVKLAIDLQNQ